MCLDVCVTMCLSGTDGDKVTRTDRMKERPCLSSGDGGQRQTNSVHDFDQQAQGFQRPQLFMNIRRIGVCFYMPVDIMNMDMMISHRMKCALEPCFMA